MKKILYLGLKPPLANKGEQIVHHPLIKVVPKPIEDRDIQLFFDKLPLSTHLIFTSQSAASIFFDYLKDFNRGLEKQCIISVGKSTSRSIELKGVSVAYTASNETQEGILNLLKNICLQSCHCVLWPRSSLARPLIKDFFENNRLPLHDCIFYTIEPNSIAPVILEEFNEIYFTSPSIVDAFLTLYGSFPKNIFLKTIGPITDAYLKKSMSES